MAELTRIPIFQLVLQAEFPINALVLATEALRIANQNSGRQLFDWNLVSHDGNEVRASNAMWMQVDHALHDVSVADYCCVFEGNRPTRNNASLLVPKLRELHRAGSTIIGIDTGAFALTLAGLVSDSAVVHWEAASTYQELFGRLPVSDQIYSMDGSVITCAGGVATLDLMLELIKRHYGALLAQEVANALIHRRREGRQVQREDLAQDDDSRAFSDRLVALLEQYLDFPLTAAQIAKRLNLSLSTLERQCHRHFGSSPMQLYLGIRLQRARNFLFYEDSSIKEVALAFGFSSPSVFSRTFRTYFGQSPSAFRRAIREKQSATRLPEVSRLWNNRNTLSGPGSN